MLRICAKCRHCACAVLGVGLCLEDHKLRVGLRVFGHAPYRVGLCPACEHFEPLNNKRAAPGAEALAEADAAAGPGEAGRAASTDRQGDAEGRA